MSASVDYRPTSPMAAVTALWLAFGAFGLAILGVLFVATVELMNAGENVLIETLPGLVLIQTIATWGVYSAYSEVRALEIRPLARPKLLLISGSLLLIISLVAMTAAILYRTTGGI